LAAKAGVAAAAETAGAAAAPATGGLSLLVSAAIEVGQRAMKALKSLIPRKLKGWMQENKKYIAGASIVVFGMGLVFANPLFLLGGVGMGLIGWQLGGFIGLGAAIFAGLVAPFFTRLFGTMLATFAVIVLLTALCYLIITSGAYLTPYNPNAITTRGPQQSQFFTVSKLVEGQSYYQSQSADVTVTYTITISPLQGDLTNISFQSNCTVSQVTQTSQNCPTPTNITVNYGPNDGSFPPPVPTTIYASNPYNITYQRTFNSQTYNDSLITDIFTVSADVGAGIRSSGAGSASLALGNPPSDCPAGWPVRNVTRADGSQNYHMSQGPMGSFSHAGQEAVDIAPYPDSTHWDPNVDILYATHQGTVQTSSGTYGNWVRITGNCGAYGGSFSSLQGHLLSFLVSDGDIVNRGDPIGIMGNSGIVSTGAHVHYEFVNNPQIIMDNVQGQMFIPVSRQRILGCTLFTCNLPIP
jgi:murein DD-endopeptidase MepM/ murein hydrolase activator NlpD